MQKYAISLSYIRSLLGNAGHVLLGNKQPSWMLPLFGAAAASPIVGYELNKHRLAKHPANPQDAVSSVPGEEEIEKASAAIKRAVGEAGPALSPGGGFGAEQGPPAPSDTVQRLDGLKAMMQRAKNRASTPLESKTPSIGFQEGMVADSRRVDNRKVSARPEGRIEARMAN